MLRNRSSFPPISPGRQSIVDFISVLLFKFWGEEAQRATTGTERQWLHISQDKAVRPTEPRTIHVRDAIDDVGMTDDPAQTMAPHVS